MPFFRRRDDKSKIEAIRLLLSQGAEAFDRGRTDESAAILIKAKSAAEELGRAGDGLRCSVLSSLSAAATRQGQFEDAQASLDAATAIIVANHWQYTSRHYWVMINTAVLNWTKGDKPAAMNFLQHAHQELTSRARINGYENILIGLLENLCGYSLETDALADAERWLSLAKQQLKNGGEKYPWQWSRIYHLQVGLAKKTGQLATKLDPLAREAAHIGSTIGPNHPAMHSVRAALGSAVSAAGKLDQAAEILQEARVLLAEDCAPMVKSKILNELGMVELRRKRYPQAEELFREDLSMLMDQSKWKTDKAVAIALNNIGVAVREQNRLPDAERFLLQAIQVGDAVFEPNHFHPANAMKNLAQTYALMGRGDRAIELYQTAIGRMEKAPSSSGPVAAKLAEARELLARLQRR